MAGWIEAVSSTASISIRNLNKLDKLKVTGLVTTSLPALKPGGTDHARGESKVRKIGICHVLVRRRP
jgi:hypothetical protein